MTKNAKILFLSQNPPTNARHGGTKRSAQVLETLRRTEYDVATMPEIPAESNRLRRAIHGTWLALKLFRAFPTGPGALRQNAKIGIFFQSYSDILDGFPSARVLVVEPLEMHAYAVFAAVSRGLRVICVPQNIETTIGGIAPFPKAISQWVPFQHTILALGRADAVFTISMEEQWLLRGFGIEAEYFPYYPAEQELTALNSLRERRKRTSRTHFLILGSAIHTPTREGMVQLVQWLSEFPNRERHAFTLAGYGVSSLNVDTAVSWLQVCESLTDEELGEKMASARGIIAHQKAGSGALTRVCEALCAGIPVIASLVAARSYHGRAGMNSYSTREELYRLLDQDLPDPQAPGRPSVSDEQFIATVKRYAS